MLLSARFRSISLKSLSILSAFVAKQIVQKRIEGDWNSDSKKKNAIFDINIDFITKFKYLRYFQIKQETL